MKKKFVIIEGIIVISFILLTTLGINYINSPAGVSMSSNTIMHTYLVKIPDNSCVCPYALETMTKGKLKVVHETGCTCPYIQNSSYMTTTCKDIRSIISLLPADIQKTVQVMEIKKTETESRTKFL